MNNLQRKANSVDVMFLLEGTFPYVSGGVSAWVDQIIRAFPDISFGILFLGGRKQDYGEPRYALPDNVSHFEAHYLHETGPAVPVRGCKGDAEAFARVEELHECLHHRRGLENIGGLISKLLPMMAPGGKLDEQQFLHSEQAWKMLTSKYEQHSTDPSFTDYFWTIRIMHKPLWLLAELALKAPRAKLYHTVSTGYAGFLGALLHYHTGSPLLCSEHGIYTKERKIDLLQSSWIQDNRSIFEKDISRAGYFQELWVRFFEKMGLVCYQAASDITSLYEGNRQKQITDGAPADKTRCIPNGVAVEKLASLAAQRPAQPPLVVGLIGRVVPIKDVKTFIRTIFVARKQMPDIQGWIIGPETEDPAYAIECHELVTSLGLENNLRFLGFRRIEEILPQLGLLALSSISEALPLVVLEAYAAGVPVVATDVGACRQLIEGHEPEDRALGCAGAVIPIANPEIMASVIITLLSDSDVWQAAQRAGMTRVKRLYDDSLITREYGGLYRKLLAQSADDTDNTRQPVVDTDQSWRTPDGWRAY